MLIIHYLSRNSNGKLVILSPQNENFLHTYISDITVDFSNALRLAAPNAGGLIKITEKNK
jgi:hypothetical protein